MKLLESGKLSEDCVNLSDELYNIAIKTLNHSDLGPDEKSLVESELVQAASSRQSASKLRKIIHSLAVRLQEDSTPPAGDLVQDFTALNLLESDATALVEKGIAPVTIIRPGFNTSKSRFYGKNMLARDHKVFEGAKMFLDHASDSPFSSGVRSIKDWAASLKNVRVAEDGSLVGDAVIIDTDFRSKLRTLRESGLISEMGVSINAYAKAKEDTISDIPTLNVESIVACESVDFVSFPGAGGHIQAYEHASSKMLQNLTLEILERERPDLVSKLRGTKGDIPMDQAQELEAAKQKIATLEADLAKAQGEDELAKAVAAKEAAEKDLAQIKQDMANVQAEALKAAISAKLAESKLPEVAIKRLQGQSFASVEDLQKAVESEAEYLKSLKVQGIESVVEGKVHGLGPTQDTNSAPTVSIEEALATLPGMTKERAKLAANA